MTKCITSLIGSTAQTSQSSLTGWNGWMIKLAKTVGVHKLYYLSQMVDVVQMLKLG